MRVIFEATSDDPGWVKLEQDLSSTHTRASMAVTMLRKAGKDTDPADQLAALTAWFDSAAALRRSRATLVRNVAERVCGNEQEIGLGILHTPLHDQPLHIPNPNDSGTALGWAVNDDENEVRWFEFLQILQKNSDAVRINSNEHHRLFTEAFVAAISHQADLSRIADSGSVGEKRAEIWRWMEWRGMVKCARREIVRDLAKRAYGVHDERILKILGGDDE